MKCDHDLLHIWEATDGFLCHSGAIGLEQEGDGDLD